MIPLYRDFEIEGLALARAQIPPSFFVDAAFLPAVRMNDGALSVFLCVILFSIKLFPALARI